MKKIILAVTIAFLAAACSQQRAWTEKEKEKIRVVVRDHKDKSFIRHLKKDRYADLEECVVTTVTATYPDYNKYTALAGQNDTLVGVIVTCTSDILGPDYRNLPDFFPLAQFQADSILPAGITDKQAKEFYHCLAGKIKSVYPSPYMFVMSLMNDSSASDNFVQSARQCATEITAPKPQEEPKKK